MEGVIKQWFMWVKPNFENVGAFFEFPVHAAGAG